MREKKRLKLSLTLSILEKLKNSIFEIPIIPQTLNINHSLYYVRKIFRKANVSFPLIRLRTCAHQGVRSYSFSKDFAYVLNE